MAELLSYWIRDRRVRVLGYLHFGQQVRTRLGMLEIRKAWGLRRDVGAGGVGSWDRRAIDPSRDAEAKGGPAPRSFQLACEDYGEIYPSSNHGHINAGIERGQQLSHRALLAGVSADPEFLNRNALRQLSFRPTLS